jgi:aryl-alcohol dehydrogenase-like predicted oxidoreductase
MRMMQTEWRRESLVIAKEIKRHAEVKGISPVQFAFAWVLNNRLVTAAIAGPRTIEQLEDYLPALEYGFGPDDEEVVGGLVAAGHPSTPGFIDPAYPVEGRLTWTRPTRQS